MKYLLDAHTHTLASGHAYSTMTEMVEAAAEKKLAVLGITEHAPLMPGSCKEFYFQNLKAVSREYYQEKFGVRLLLGAELNIIDYKGTVDLPVPTLKRIDLCIASMHRPCLKYGSREENTEAAVRAMDNPFVNIIGHPDDSRFPLDYLALVQAAKEKGVLLEVNNSSMNPGSYRMGARDNYKIMLDYCMRYQVPVVVDSDAHFRTAVGAHENASGVFEEIGFPEELVVNGNPEKFEKFLYRKQ